jgi:hypothetical protein
MKLLFNVDFTGSWMSPKVRDLPPGDMCYVTSWYGVRMTVGSLHAH